MADVRTSTANLSGAGGVPHRSNANLFHGGTDASTAAMDTSKKTRAGAVNLVEKKRASLDARHRYLLEKFGAAIDEKPVTLENSLLVGNKLDVVNDFLAEGGSRRCLFFWQPAGKVSFLLLALGWE